MGRPWMFEEEDGVFYEDRSNDIINDENPDPAGCFSKCPDHFTYGLFTREAMEAIESIMLKMPLHLKTGRELVNEL